MIKFKDEMVFSDIYIYIFFENVICKRNYGFFVIVNVLKVVIDEIYKDIYVKYNMMFFLGKKLDV